MAAAVDRSTCPNKSSMLMNRRLFIALLAASGASTRASAAFSGNSLESGALRPFGWSDAESRVSVNWVTVAPEGNRFVVQVTRPLSEGGFFAQPATPRWNCDLRGELWLLDKALDLPRRLSSGRLGVWLPSFSPDGQRLAALTSADPGKVGLVVWELNSGQERHFLDCNLDIYFAHFRNASSACAAPDGSLGTPHRYLWVSPTEIIFVDHGQVPQQFDLARSDLSATLQAFRERTFGGHYSARIWTDGPAPCGRGAKLLKLDCVSGSLRTIFCGDVRGISVSPDSLSAALLVATKSLPPVENAPVDPPLGVNGLDDPMVRLGFTVVDIGSGRRRQDFEEVEAVGAVPPGRLPLWSKDGMRVVVPVRTTYSDKPSTGDDAAWEIFVNTRARKRWPAASALDAQLLAALLTTPGLNCKAVIERRPTEVTQDDYVGGQIRGGAWSCSPTHVLYWSAPSVVLIGAAHTLTLPGNFASIQAPEENGTQCRTLGVHPDGSTSIITTWADSYRIDHLNAGVEWRLLRVCAKDPCAVYVHDSDNGTFLILASTCKRPRISPLEFNTFLRYVAQPKRRTLVHKFPDGSLRRGELRLPIGHKVGQRHPVIVFAYPNAVPSQESAISRVNSDLSVIYPIQYLLGKGFAFFHAPFPIHGKDAGNPMYAARDAVLPWLDVLDRQAEIIPGCYGFWGQSNAGYVALALEALSDRFKAIVAWDTFPEIGYDSLHSSDMDVALECSANIIQENRFFYEGRGQPFAPQPTPPWKSPETYIRNDPLFNLSNAATPILLIEGEFDTSPREMEETYSILRGRGVSAELAYYWGEGHVFGSPGNIHDSWLRTEAFFRRHLLAGAR